MYLPRTFIIILIILVVVAFAPYIDDILRKSILLDNESIASVEVTLRYISVNKVNILTSLGTSIIVSSILSQILPLTVDSVMSTSLISTMVSATINANR